MKLYVWLFMFTLMLTSCLPRPKFAPDFSTMPTDPYGSSIKVRHKNVFKKLVQTEGELLATENDTLYVLTNEKFRQNNTITEVTIVKKISKYDITSFYLHYAKLKGSKAYMVSSAFILLHGFYSLITIPANIFMLMITETSETNYYSLTQKNISFNNLYKYARYPQGIPPGLDLSALQTRQEK